MRQVKNAKKGQIKRFCGQVALFACIFKEILYIARYNLYKTDYHKERNADADGKKQCGVYSRRSYAESG